MGPVDLRKPKADLTSVSNDDDPSDLGSSSDGSASGDLGGAGGDMVVSSTVTGKMNITYILGDGTTASLPVNLSNAFLTAYLPNDTGFEPLGLDATTNADGTFEITDVPPGTFYLEVLIGSQPPVYYVTDARILDLGFAVAGRADAVLAGPGTELQLYVNFPSGQTWDPNFSNIQFYSANAGSE